MPQACSKKSLLRDPKFISPHLRNRKDQTWKAFKHSLEIDINKPLMPFIILMDSKRIGSGVSLAAIREVASIALACLDRVLLTAPFMSFEV
jgi:hypothetical protein